MPQDNKELRMAQWLMPLTERTAHWLMPQDNKELRIVQQRKGKSVILIKDLNY
jgi:hypothetical protein